MYIGVMLERARPARGDFGPSPVKSNRQNRGERWSDGVVEGFVWHTQTQGRKYVGGFSVSGNYDSTDVRTEETVPRRSTRTRASSGATVSRSRSARCRLPTAGCSPVRTVHTHESHVYSLLTHRVRVESKTVGPVSVSGHSVRGLRSRFRTGRRAATGTFVGRATGVRTDRSATQRTIEAGVSRTALGIAWFE